MEPPHLLFERSGVLALQKPAGLATQAPPGVASLERWVRRLLYGPDAEGYVGVPHRLDRAVSGVVLMTASRRAARKLSRQFERHEITKEYRAIVEQRAVGWEGGEWQEWRDFLEKVPEEARARLAAPATPGAREAVTRAALLGRVPASAGADRLILRLEPRTGRMHQLRLQAASRGLPIVGDVLYDPLASPIWWMARDMVRPVPFPEDVRERPIALHAISIRYADPDTGEPVVAAAATPAFWPLASA